MPETLHIFDPDGDVDFVYTIITDQKSVADDNVEQESCNEHPGPDPQTTGTGDQSAVAEGHGEREKEDSNEEQRVRIRVSSKHMKLASPVFRRMSTGPWKESQDLAAGERIEIKRGDRDVESIDALLILMNVIHGHGRKVPREVTLDTLADIAMHVDYMECYEAVDVMAEIWIDKLLKSMPFTFCDDIVSWIFISWVFQQPSAFTTATKIAVTQSQQRIDPGSLAIPQRILDKIEENRRDGVKSALDMCYELITDLRDGRKHCSDVCDGLRLGLLVKQLHAGGKLPPLPADSIPNVSLMQLTSILQFTPTVRYCDSTAVEIHQPNPSYRREIRHVLSLHGCDLHPLVQPILQDVQNRLRGFEPGDFKDQSKAPGGNNSKASSQ